MGDQNLHGEVTRRAWINGQISLTAADLRQLARMAIAVADELDELSDLDASIKP
ncbi:MAG: hypothetical protein WBV80_28280 [Mycobacterium sp.]